MKQTLHPKRMTSLMPPFALDYLFSALSLFSLILKISGSTWFYNFYHVFNSVLYCTRVLSGFTILHLTTEGMALHHSTSVLYQILPPGGV